MFLENNYDNFINESYYDNNDAQSILSFHDFLFNGPQFNTTSSFLNSNELNDLYYLKKQSDALELEDIIKDNFPLNEKKSQNIVKNRTKTTAEKTILPIIHKKKDKIFEIKKEKKSLLGRKRKNQLPNNNNNDASDFNNVHTKNRKDDIFTKLKRNSYNNSSKCLNHLLKKSKNKNLNTIQLKKIDNSILIVSKKEENLDLLKTKLKDLFSNNISIKYKYIDIEYNKKAIKYILKQNDKEINHVLEKAFGDMMEIYVDKNKETIDGFTKLKDDKKFFEKNNDVEYIKLFKDFASKFEEKINNISPRRKRTKNS